MTKAQTKQLNDLIKAGKTAEAGQFLLSLDAPTEKKKRGRPKKVTEDTIRVIETVTPPPEKPQEQAEFFVTNQNKQASPSQIQRFKPMQFADYGVGEKLPYPAPTQRRPPVQKVKVECGKCHNYFLVYPSQIQRAPGVDGGITYQCNGCSCGR